MIGGSDWLMASFNQVSFGFKALRASLHRNFLDGGGRSYGIQGKASEKVVLELMHRPTYEIVSDSKI